MEFKPEDLCSVMPNVFGIMPKEAARLANAKLEEWRKSWVMVYGIIMPGTSGFWTDQKYSEGSSLAKEYLSNRTHQAYLVEIEELPKQECEHEPKICEKCKENAWRITTLFAPELKHDCFIKCKHCGKKLKATWQLAED